MQVRERMRFDENGKSKLYFFDNCKAIIRCMPLMMFDEHNPEDLDSSLEDHCLDELRYFCMSNIVPPRIIQKKIVPMVDPLEQFSKEKSFYGGF
jgi:hypothetical protein